jgi:hypothetical protein
MLYSDSRTSSQGSSARYQRANPRTRNRRLRCYDEILLRTTNAPPQSREHAHRSSVRPYLVRNMFNPDPAARQVCSRIVSTPSFAPVRPSVRHVMSLFFVCTTDVADVDL